MSEKNLAELVTFLKRDLKSINKNNALTVLANVIDTERYTHSIVGYKLKNFVTVRPTVAQRHIQRKSNEINYVRTRIMITVNNCEELAMKNTKDKSSRNKAYNSANKVLKQGRAALAKLDNYKGDPIVYGSPKDEKIHRITLNHIQNMIRADAQKAKEGLELANLAKSSTKKNSGAKNVKPTHRPVQLSLGI